MENQLKYLEWDSDFFKKKIYRLDSGKDIDHEKIVNLTRNIDLDLVYLFLKQELRGSLNEKFFLADKKIIFKKKILADPASANDPSIISTNQLTSQLYELAYLSGIYSRFKLDPMLNTKFTHLYSLWLEKSVYREIASEVLVFREGDKDIGFVTIKKTEGLAVIGLIAVNELSHGKSIGSLLLQAAENWCINNNVNTIEVATQLDNIKACGFYKKNGFSQKQIDYIYHFYK